MDASKEQLIEYANLFRRGRTQFFESGVKTERAISARFYHTHVCLRGACDILQLVQIASRHRRLTSYSHHFRCLFEGGVSH